MWMWRLFGLALAASGGALMAFLWAEVMDRSGRTLFIHRAGMPVDLLLAMASLCAVLIGLHLVFRAKATLHRINRGAPRGA